MHTRQTGPEDEAIRPQWSNKAGARPRDQSPAHNRASLQVDSEYWRLGEQAVVLKRGRRERVELSIPQTPAGDVHSLPQDLPDVHDAHEFVAVQACAPPHWRFDFVGQKRAEFLAIQCQIFLPS